MHEMFGLVHVLHVGGWLNLRDTIGWLAATVRPLVDNKLLNQAQDVSSPSLGDFKSPFLPPYHHIYRFQISRVPSLQLSKLFRPRYPHFRPTNFNRSNIIPLYRPPSKWQLQFSHLCTGLALTERLCLPLQSPETPPGMADPSMAAVLRKERPGAEDTVLWMSESPWLPRP